MIKLPAIFKTGRRAFWVWIAYQTIKGTLTTAFIWAPLIYIWWQSS